MKDFTTTTMEQLRSAMINNETVEGYVMYSCYGGLVININNINTLLPDSEIPHKTSTQKGATRYDDYKGRVLQLKVKLIDEESHRIIVTLAQDEQNKDTETEASTLEHHEQMPPKEGFYEGQIVEGRITNIIDKGVFVDLGDACGFIHISQLSYDYVEHPQDVVSKGDNIKVMIQSIDPVTKRIVLSLKHTKPHPWDVEISQFKRGDTVNAHVIGFSPKGVIVKLSSHIVGHVQNSELVWEQPYPEASDVLTIGQEVECKIVRIRHENRKVDLSIKQLLPRPWVGFDESTEVGDLVKVRVYAHTKSGMVVEMAPKLRVLIPHCEISWDENFVAAEAYNIGDEVECVVTHINRFKRKINLSIKDATNPWDAIDPNLAVGDRVKVKVLSFTTYGAFATLCPGVFGIIHYSELTWINPTPRADFIINEGDIVECVVAYLDRTNKRVAFSIKRLFSDPWDTIEQRYNVGDRVKGKVVVCSNIGAYISLGEGIVAFLHNTEMSYTSQNYHSHAILNVGQEVICAISNIDRSEQRFDLTFKGITTNPWDEILEGQSVVSRLSSRIREFFGIEPETPSSPIFSIEASNSQVENDSVTIPLTVKIIGCSAFRNCSKIEEVAIHSMVIGIGYGAFAGCTGINDLYIPDSVKYIATDAFDGCKSLTSVRLPMHTSIHHDAFRNCNALEHIYIPIGTTDYYRSCLPEALHHCIIERQSA